MSIEVLGKRPDARVGEYARYPNARWTALIACTSELAPTETRACSVLFGKNEISAETGIALADQLDRCISDGSVKHYIAQRNSYLAEHPSVLCAHCLGTRLCYQCEGEGTTDTSHSYKDLYIEDVQDFIEFARHSGGFAVRDEKFTRHSSGSAIRDEILPEGLLLSNFGLLRDPEGRLLGFNSDCSRRAAE